MHVTSVVVKNLAVAAFIPCRLRIECGYIYAHPAGLHGRVVYSSSPIISGVSISQAQ